jgi:hypothetical protein
MKQRSPTLEGFQTMFRLPSLGLAEIAWRWSFGLAATAVVVFAIREYLSTLPVTAGEMLLLRTRQPVLMLQALARIFQGSAPRAVAAFLVLTLTLALAWIVLASLGRAASVKAVTEYFRGPVSSNARFSSLFALNSLRVATMLAATVGVAGAVLVAKSASRPDNPSPGAALLIFWLLTVLIGVICSLLNWYLSLASVFAVREGTPAFTSLIAAIDLCRTRSGSLVAAGTSFGIAHVILFVVASSAIAFPLGFAEVLPGGMVFGGVLLVTLLYFAAADFLYVGRLASYVFILLPKEEATEN